MTRYADPFGINTESYSQFYIVVVVQSVVHIRYVLLNIIFDLYVCFD